MKVKIKTQQQKEEHSVLQLQNVQLIGGGIDGTFSEHTSIPLIDLLDDEDLFPHDSINDVDKEVNNNYETQNNSTTTENNIVPTGVKTTEIKEENNDNENIYTEDKTNTTVTGVIIKEEPDDSTIENITTNNTNIINNNFYLNLQTTNSKTETADADQLTKTANETNLEIQKLVEYYNAINKISIVIVQAIHENINCAHGTNPSNIAEKKRVYEARKKKLFDSVKEYIETYLVSHNNNQSFLNKLLESTRKQAKNNFNITEAIFKLYVKELINHVAGPVIQSSIIINNSNTCNNDSISYQSVTMSAKNQSVFQQMPYAPTYANSANVSQIQNYGNENYLYPSADASWPTVDNYASYNQANVYEQGTSTLPSFNQNINPHQAIIPSWNNVPEQRNTYNNGVYNNIGVACGNYTRVGYGSWPVDHNQYRATNVNSERAVQRFEPYPIGQSSIQRGTYDCYGKSYDNTNVSHGTTYDHYSGGTFFTPPPTYGQSVNAAGSRAVTSSRGTKSAVVGVDRRRRQNLSQLQLQNVQVNAAVPARPAPKVDGPALYCGRYPHTKLNTLQKCCVCSKKAAFTCGMCHKIFFCSDGCKVQSVIYKIACTRMQKIM